MSVSGIMCNGTIHELLIPPIIARKTDLELKFIELKQMNETQQMKIDEYQKIIQQHSVMFELLRQRIEALEKNLLKIV